MSLVSQNDLKTNYWLHKCSAKEGALVYNQKGDPCMFCKKTEQQAKTDKEWVENK